MTCTTSKRFAGITATGADWRAVTRQLLEEFETARAAYEAGADSDDDQGTYTLGFLYVSDHLAGDLPGMLESIRSITGIAHWTGTVGYGVCGNGIRHVDVPAASLLVGAFDPDSFCVFPPADLVLSRTRATLDPWLDAHDAMLTLVHGDPAADSDPALVMAALDGLGCGFIAGGMTQSRHASLQIADKVVQGGISGVAFSSDIAVATTLTQGCAPVGPTHTITHAEGQFISELDGRRSFDVFAEDLKTMALRRAGENPEGATLSGTLDRDEYQQLDPGVKSLFSGDVHVAFPVPGSDQRDYMVRHITGLDPDSGILGVPQPVENGQHLLFVHRDEDTIRSDLLRTMNDLRIRLIREQGRCAPQGGIYISCADRAQKGRIDDEMTLIRETLGDFPLAGYYARNEISNRRLYGYTGVLILFL